MWNSNFPAFPGSLSEIEQVCAAAFVFLPPTDVDKIMGGNALRMYPGLR